MTIEQITKGMTVHDPLFGYGEVLKVHKTTVWVKLYPHEFKTIYDLDHLQFLNRG